MTLSCMRQDWEAPLTLLGSFMGPETNMLKICVATELNMMVEISSLAPSRMRRMAGRSANRAPPTKPHSSMRGMCSAAGSVRLMPTQPPKMAPI